MLFIGGMVDWFSYSNKQNIQWTSSILCTITQATKSLDLVAAEILASRQEVNMEDEEEDEKKPFIDIVLEETEVGP